jgi:hypothetical protein
MSLETDKPDSVTAIVQHVAAENDATKTAEGNAPSVDLDDPDQAELAAARAAVAGETNPEPKPEQPKPDANATGEQPAKPADGDPKPADAKPTDANPTPAKPGKDNPVIPVPRDKLKALSERAKSAEDAAAESARAAAYWKGVADTKAASPAQPAAQPAQPTLTPKEQLAAIRQQRLDLSDKLDSGEINNRKFEEERQRLEDAEEAIRQAMAIPARAEPAPTRTGNDLYLEERTAQLETQFKYASLITDEAHWDFLQREAAKQLRAEGVVFAKGELPPAQALQLRTRISELTDTYGPLWTGKSREEVYGKAPVTKPAATATPTPGPAAPMSPTAKARAEKLAEAREAPPDLTAVGSAGTVPGDLSPAAITGMDDEDIIKNMPKAARDKLMGRLPS